MLKNNQNIPSLAKVMSEAGREVLNVSNNSNVKQSKTGYPQIKVAHYLTTQVTNDRYRMAQVNNTTTQPNFYSPFLTPSSFQIPNTRKEVYLWANFWRNNEPKVAAGINFYTNFPFNGWKIECKSSVVKDYFEKLIQKLNFQKWLPLISQSYHLYGDAFVLASLDCPICNGTNVNQKTNQICTHEGASWKSLAVLNPDSVMITPGFMDQSPTYAYLPNDREIKVVTQGGTGGDEELFESIPEEVRVMISKKLPIKLNSICIHHFKHGADSWSDYGTSLVRPLFVSLAYKDKLRQAQWIVAERHILPVRIVTVGDSERPASQEDLDSVQEQLSNVANDPNLTLVTPHAFDYKFVGANGQVLQLTNEFEHIDEEILDGLMLNKSLLNGEGPAYGNAQIGLLSMNERLETWRREVAQWIEEKIFKPVAKWNGFTATGEGGQEELIYPQIIFDDLKLKDNTGTLQMMVTAQANGVLSAETLVEQFGLSWDQEVERLRFEQGMNFVNSAEVMGTDMNIGFGGVTGAGFGAGGGGGAPGGGGPLNQPLTPGAGPEGIPGGEVGGAPGASIGPEAPLPPPTAATLHNQYKIAAETMNEIMFNRIALASLSDKKFISKIDKEINTKSPVTGRSYIGEIPDNLNPISPWNIKSAGSPLNFQAHRDVKLGKVKEKQQFHGYTGLEKKLYQIVMSMNIPLAFYAQYEAGPSKEYVLDGAFPVIKLGVEADGEIWHNNVNKIEGDKNRDTNLARQGWTILRFTDKEIEKQPRDVAAVITQALQKLMSSNNAITPQTSQIL